MATRSGILIWRIPMDRGAWHATAHRVAKELDTAEQLRTAQPSIARERKIFLLAQQQPQPMREYHRSANEKLLPP